MAKRAVKKTASPEKIEWYEKLVATNQNVVLKGDTVPYTSINGNMSSYLSKDGRLGIRLPSAEREAFIVKYNARLCQSYGVVQPEYVEVPDHLILSTRELKKWFDISFEYVSSLKPKATVKKKKA